MKQLLKNHCTKSNFILFGTFFSLSLFFFNCQTKNQNNSSEYGIEDTTGFNTGFEEVELAMGVYHLFPSPNEMISIINEADITYIPGAINPPENIKKYIDPEKQKINLGIYLADLSYSAFLGKKDEAHKSFNAAFELSKEIKLSVAFDKEFTERIKSNIENMDSLVVYANEIYFELIEYLEMTERKADLAIITASGYIESVFLAISSIEVFSPDNLIIQQIAEQKYAFTNLINYANAYKKDPELEKIFSNMELINHVLNKFEEKNNEITVSESTDGIININGGTDFIVEQEDFDELKKLVTDIRTDLIE